MPIVINFRNVDSYVLYDKPLQQKLPDFTALIEQWKIGVKSPVFAAVAQKARLDFLDRLNHDHLAILEEHLGDKVYVARLNYHLVSDFTCSVDDLECFLMDHDSFDDNFCIARNANSCAISFWR